MAELPNDDLFEGTKMSFGDHLEELRACLLKSLVGIVIGVLIGLSLGKAVIGVISAPLTKALTKHQTIKAELDLKRRYPDINLDEGRIRTWLDLNLTPDIVYVEKDLLSRLEVESPTPKAAAATPTVGAEKTVPDKAPAENAPAAEKSEEGEPLPIPESDLVQMRLWKPVKMNVTALNAQEAFMIWMKAGVVAGLVLSAPWVFFQIWTFIASGLYPHEKKYVYLYLPMSMLLFLSGVLLTYFFVFSTVLDFLFSYNRWLNIDPEPRISEWLGFVLMLPIGFGVSFQLPLIMLFMYRIGIVPLSLYTANWRISILVIFFIAMILTPADPYSMVLMAGPLTFLYFFGIMLCKFTKSSRRNPFGVE